MSFKLFCKVFTALFVLSACSGAQLPAAARYSSSNVQGTQIGVAHNGSWMSPEARVDDLVYIADAVAESVEVYSYPQLKRVGQLRGGQPVGDCTDPAGNIWIVDRAKRSASKYSHAGLKPIETLHLEAANALFQDCSVDPTAGDLAVTTDTVYVFPRAKAPPAKYSIHVFFGEIDSCGYDGGGNLFVGGTDGYGSLDSVAAVWELQNHQRPLRRLKFHHALTFRETGSIRWDGREVAWADFKEIARNTEVIYRFKIHKQSGSFVGRVNLRLSQAYPGQFWILGNTIIAPSYSPTLAGEVVRRLADGAFHLHFD